MLGTKLLFFSCLLSYQFILLNGKSYKEDLAITSKQKLILDKFREQVAHRLPHEYMRKGPYLIRWLRAKNWNINEAEVMLMNNIQWRAEHKMDTIHNENWNDYYRDYKYHLESVDKEGKPILYMNIGGSWDIRKASVSGKSAKFLRYIDKSIDEGCSLARNLGEKYHNVSQGLLIINADGFNLQQHGCLPCISIIIRIIHSYESHQPGCADKIIVANVPAIAAPVIQAARLALNPETNKSFFVYGTNKMVVKEALLRDIDIDQLPVELGGTKQYKNDLDD